MKTHTDNNKSGGSATIEKQRMTTGTPADEFKGRLKYQSDSFKPKPSLLLDALPEVEVKPPIKALPHQPKESSQEMLQNLLINTEASAQRTQWAKMKWQLTSLFLLMVLVPTIIVTAWLYSETGRMGAQRGRLEAENLSLKEQLNSTGLRITGLKEEVDTLLNRNLALAAETSELKARIKSFTAGPSVVAKKEPGPAAQDTIPKPIAVSQPLLDSARLEAIRKGAYPKGATRDELIAVLGQPDRLYKSRSYEQLVYFGRKPARFWLVGDWLVQTSN
jgi:hypothetical protein